MLCEKLEFEWQNQVNSFNPKIVVNNVPKSVLNKLAAKYSIDIREEGVTQFIEFDFLSFDVKLKRIKNGRD